MPVTQHPLRRSVRAELPHTAPGLGNDDQANTMQPVVSVSDRLSHEPGSMSGTRCQQTNSLGPPPSLHHLRRRASCRHGLVRQLLRYYAAVRFPASVAHRCTPIGFSMRSARGASQRAPEDGGTSRFPNKVLACVRRVCDRAGSMGVSPKRRPRCDLRLVPTASAPQSAHALRRGACISRLNTRPARPPVNASPTPLRMCTHDSGPP